MSLLNKFKELVLCSSGITDNQCVSKPKEEVVVIGFRDKISKREYVILKNQAKAHALSTRAMRETAVKNNGEVRKILRFLKSKEGQTARLYHVALCFLKGKKYSEVEPNVLNHHKIKADKLEDILFYSVNGKYRKILVDELNKFLES